jgi:hypothetical protein
MTALQTKRAELSCGRSNTVASPTNFSRDTRTQGGLLISPAPLPERTAPMATATLRLPTAPSAWDRQTELACLENAAALATTAFRAALAAGDPASVLATLRASNAADLAALLYRTARPSIWEMQTAPRMAELDRMDAGV